MTRFEDADKLTESKSSLGQWIVITIAALFVSVGMIFLVSMVGFMLYDFVLLMLPMLVIIGAFAGLVYWIYRTAHHNFPRAHHP